MVGTAHPIVAQIYNAKTDPEAADAFIGQYIGFIRSETVKFTHAAPEDGHEDELSIAMLAFYEAILSSDGKAPRKRHLPPRPRRGRGGPDPAGHAAGPPGRDRGL